MSAFGYGSAYSFKTGDYNPGFTQGMGQDPRQIVAKSGIDSMKSGLPSGQSAAPVGSSADPFGLNFASNPNPNLDIAPLFGNPAESNQLSFLGLRQNVGNLSLQNQGAQIAGSAINSVNPYAYYGGTPSDAGTSGFTAGQNAQNYQQAFDYLNSARDRIGFNPTDGSGGDLSSSLNMAMGNVKSRYQQWLDQMLRGGSFGLTGGGLSYGR